MDLVYLKPPFYDSIEIYEEERMSQKEDIEQIKKDVQDIRDNHLAGLCKRVRNLEGKMWYVIGAGTIIAMIVSAILTVILMR